MDQIQIRNTVLPQADDETTVKLNFNITFASGVTIKDASVSISLEEYENTLPKDQPALVAKYVLAAFENYEK